MLRKTKTRMEKTKDKKHLNIVGSAGEYFVAAELSQRGIIATLTLKNTPRIDVIATNLLNGTVANLQVKTMSIDNNAGWRMGETDEADSKIKNHYYVLVNLHGLGQLPEYIVIPQPKLSKFLKEDYKNWISGKKKDGTDRKLTPMRVFDPYRKKHIMEFAKEYINNWEVLGLW